MLVLQYTYQLRSLSGPVEKEADASGCQVEVDIDHPEWILFVTKWVQISTKKMMGMYKYQPKI